MSQDLQPKANNDQQPQPVPANLASLTTPVTVEMDEPSVPLVHYLWVLKRQAWKILAVVVACGLATLLISWRLTPIYESTAIVDFDFRTPTGVLGRESVQPMSHDVDQYLATQVRLLQSDSVLRPVVMKYKLYEREKNLFELWTSDNPFDEEAPIKLEDFSVRRPPNTHLLNITYRSEDRELAANVANAIAHSYLEHTFRIRYQAASDLSRFMERQLEELRATMERSNGALAQYEKDLSIINPEEQTNILTARLLELNTEYTRAQAERVAREAAHRSVDGLVLEAAQVAARQGPLVQLDEDYNEARKKLAEVAAHYGPNHPEFRIISSHLAEVEKLRKDTVASIGKQTEIEYEQALDREEMLAAELQSSREEFDDVKSRSFEYQALKREADGDKRLYEELLRKIKEATINSSFQNTAARIADPARPGLLPVFPRIPLNLVLVVIFSTLIAIGVAIARDSMDNSLRDPDEVARLLGTDVVGSLPVVKDWRGRLSIAEPSGAKALSAAHGNRYASSATSYTEAIRTLRNSILLQNLDGGLNSLLVTSASPGEGKSTTATHLAIAHAQQGRRTLLIDGDLRRPSVHKRFGINSKHGLSNVLTGEEPWEDLVVKPEEVPNLEVLPAGPATSSASDLIGRGLGEVLASATASYDLVVLDAPPLLGFAEPLFMATVVDGVLVVTRAGETNRKAVASVVNTLHKLRATVLGVVLNEVRKELSDSYYYYGYYRKYYYGQNGQDTAA